MTEDGALIVMQTTKTLCAMALLVATIGLSGCSSTTEAPMKAEDIILSGQKVPAQTPPANQLEAQKNAGVYSGVLPAADTEGIRTTLYIRPDGTYTRISEFIGADTFEEGGTWQTDDRGITHMKPANEDTPEWLMGFVEKEIVLLTAEGKPVEGPLAPHYRLKKN